MNKFTTLALTASLVAGSAFGATPSTTSATSKAAAPKFTDKLSLSYMNVFYGPSITDPVSSTQPDTDNNLARGGSPIFMKNYLSAGYKLTDSVTLSPVLYWLYQPVRDQNMTLRDPYLKLSNGKLINRGNFNLAADLRYGAPLSKASRDKSAIGYLMSKQIASYEIGRVSFSNTTYVLANAYSTAAVGKRFLEAYVGPAVDYTITPTLKAGILFEAGTFTSYGDGAFNNDGTDIEPNVSWDITPAINLNPYLDLKTTTGVSAKTTSFGAVFSWKLL